MVRIAGWSLFVVFFVCVCLPLLFFYYLFDANKVKAMVVEQFNSQNYSVVINGNVEPRSWHGLSLFISDLTVEDKSLHKVIHINTANCQLSWLDLIVAHYRVQRVALNGLTLFQGSIKEANYSNLLNYKALSHSEFKHLRRLSITNLNWVDAQGNFIIKDAGMQIHDIDSLPVVGLNFRLNNYAAEIAVKGSVDKIDDSNLIFKDIKVDLHSPKVNGEFHGSGRYDYKSQELWFSGINGSAQSKYYSEKLKIDTALLSYYGITVNKLLLDINKLNLIGYTQNLNLDIRDLKTNNFSKYTVSSLTTYFNVISSSHKFAVSWELLNARFNRSLDLSNQNCKLSFIHSLSQRESVVFGGDFNGRCSYNESSGWLNFALSGSVNHAPAKINLGYQYNTNTKSVVQVVGSFNKVDLSPFMATNQGNLMPLYFDDSKLPLQWLQWLNLSANLKFKELNLSHFNLSNVDTEIEVVDDQLKLKKIQANAYDGKLSGSGLVSGNAESGYSVAIDNMITGVSLQKVFQNLFNVSAITGRADLAINTIANKVYTYEDLHRKLNGSIELDVSNGGFSGVDFSLFLSPENLAAFQNKSAIMTKFTTLSSNFNFKNGVSEKSDVKFSAPAIRANGSGIIDFANTKLDYKLTVSSLLPKNLQNINSVSIPVAINGDLFNPKIYIQNMTLNTKSKGLPPRDRKRGKGDK